MSQEPFLHMESGTVRFWVSVNDELFGAMIRKETLHYSYHPHKQDDDPLETYEDHLEEIHEAVRLRVASGSREPVLLREADLRAAACRPALS
jgi:hypothetical protein